MNFLAHAYLSGEDQKILVGNFIGDFIKGRQALNQLDAEIVRGVELHRAIDEYTDNHAVVHESKDRLRPKYRHYAGVIVDVFYDHFLAARWREFHPRPLEEFAANTYTTVERFSDILPVKFMHMFPYMRSGNWLVNYGKISGVHRALSGMASRSPYESQMEHAAKDLEIHYDEFNEEFGRFFPRLKDFCDEWVRYRE